jgi:hypothetical protein
MESDIVRAGHGAARITLHSRDTFERGQNGNADCERDKLPRTHPHFSRERPLRVLLEHVPPGSIRLTDQRGGIGRRSDDTLYSRVLT